MKTTPVHNLSILIVSVLFVSIFISSSFSCNNLDNDFSVNPDSVIAVEINTRKIVMLGESPHSDFVLYNGLISTLNNWLRVCEKDNSREFVLNLVLEIDSASARIFDKYLHTGIDSALYREIAPYWNLEDIEYIHKLRKVGIEIERLNENRDNKIELNILGFEEVGININENYFRKTQQESERWFVNERDKNISIKLIEFIKSKSNNERYLIYYGAAHLQNGFVNKNLGFTIPIEESFGYYLIYYLKQAFGEDSVVSFMQGIYIDKIFDNTILGRYSGIDVLVPSDKLNIQKIIEPYPNSFLVLRHFVKPYVRYNPHLFPMIFSRFIIERLSEKIDLYEKYLPGYKPIQFYKRYMQSVFYITGVRFENSGELKHWLKSNPGFNGLERIDSKEYSNFIYGLFKDTVSKDNVKILNDLGFLEEDFTFYSKDSVTWQENWKNINKKVKFINAIGIFWIGYPDEKIEAKKYLIEYTREDFSEPDNYLKWFRKKFYNYSE
jgi:hypothetical protein